MKAPDSSNFWEDEDFQDKLVTLLVNDTNTLVSCGGLLRADDFKPLRGMRNGRSRWIVAERALDHYSRYHEPIGKLVRADVLDSAQRST